MRKIKMFFAASPRDLSMQRLTLNEIVDKMQNIDERKTHFPTGFAHKVSQLLEGDNTQANKSLNQKKRG